MDTNDAPKPERAAHLFQPGKSGNPGGRPKGSRNRLQGDFMRELADDFAANGKAAIETCRKEKPDKYLAIVASLMPKEVDVRRTAEDLTDDELAAIVGALRSQLEAEGVLQPDGRDGAPDAPPVPRQLPPVH